MSAIPLPSGWSDSSDGDAMQQHQEGGGGDGWDTSSDEWGAGGGHGETFHDFERVTAESTRRALLENDLLLCKDESDSSDNGNTDRNVDNDDDFSGTAATTMTHVQRQQQQRRFVPGDPFANEEADVDAWAKHFTYLAVIPTKSWPLSTASAPGTREAGPVDAAAADVTAGVAARKDTLALENVDSNVGLRQDTYCDAPSSVTRTSAAAVAEATRGSVSALPSGGPGERGGGKVLKSAGNVPGDDDDGPDPVVVGCAIGTECEDERKEGHGDAGEDTVGEMVLASHGIYEEYLAYDCRPPPSPKTSESDDDQNKQIATFGNIPSSGAGGLFSTTPMMMMMQPNTSAHSKCALQNPAVAEHDGGDGEDNTTNRGCLEDARGEGVSIDRRDIRPEAGRRDRPRRLFSPQQLELREEMMDRIFDELWNRLTPDLLQAAEQIRTSARGSV